MSSENAKWQNFETSYVQSERVLDNFAKSDLSKFKICMADTDHAIHAFFFGGWVQVVGLV